MGNLRNPDYVLATKNITNKQINDLGSVRLFFCNMRAAVLYLEHPVGNTDVTKGKVCGVLN